MHQTKVIAKFISVSLIAVRGMGTGMPVQLIKQKFTARVMREESMWREIQHATVAFEVLRDANSLGLQVSGVENMFPLHFVASLV